MVLRVPTRMVLLCAVIGVSASLVEVKRCDEPFPPDLRDEALKRELRDARVHETLSYREARRAMFGDVDNDDGTVECVYTGHLEETDDIPDGARMNTEHTWPASRGGYNGDARSDLHHLFPVTKESNSRRSNHPFGEVEVVWWERGGSRKGRDARNKTVFEPREAHRGDVARAMFYVSVMYEMSISASEESTLRVWHVDDPVDGKERERNDAVADAQTSRNPFVDHPELVGRIDDF